ncbi:MULTISPECIES: hypothetical protein [Chryseobacterium]|uniref:Outer membrane protein beta-barrel domain-containing protein n=3 Tax=Chryseobacterium TaxID=59732 RepID=A0ABR4UFD0_9FLAO|nr:MULTISPECIES: hypothetical protein [Chryseobacterium]AZB32172.1 hypothetical protein EB354_23120 [Chryseobacterium balustinum]KFF23202.1 hypothetical protein IW16_26575 [Chryseobacterium vrystaatense]REC56251.1 hypothetical protein DRF62_04085 [Chryseobacterium piscium]SHN00401.1 hypothetical protein SAMN05444360_1262 [Chryseobacterium carnipullorum]SKB93394.1 hypothetical protein SAMN05421800_1152 [Chryseobacterium balustinum]
MKKQLYLISFALLSIYGMAQDNNVEKNITGAQIGLFGLDFYNETKIANRTTLRLEASLFPAIWGGDLYGKTGFAFYPSFTLQPKYYYNISKRAENGRNTKNNSANYVGLQIRYIPDWFVISNANNVSLSNQVNVIPTYGFRRNFANNFNYEFRAGLGIGTAFTTNNNVTEAVFDLSFKIGYDF